MNQAHKFKHCVAIGLGSNLQDSKQELQKATSKMSQLPTTELIALSRFYGSKPQGPQDQPDFINAVALLSTDLAPLVLLDALQEIECNQGKVKLRHWGERLIDLDILLFDHLVLNTERLTLPHPQMHARDFVLVPLLEIWPECDIPKRGLASVLVDGLSESFLLQF